jgi:hypothetical protein
MNFRIEDGGGGRGRRAVDRGKVRFPISGRESSDGYSKHRKALALR